MRYIHVLTLLGTNHLASALAFIEPFEDLHSRDVGLFDHDVYVRDVPEIYLIKRGMSGKKGQNPPTPPRAGTPPLPRANSVPSRAMTPPPEAIPRAGTPPGRASTPPLPNANVPQRSGAGTPVSGAGSPGLSRAGSSASSVASMDSPPRQLRSGTPDPVTPDNQPIPLRIPGAPARRPLQYMAQVGQPWWPPLPGEKRHDN